MRASRLPDCLQPSGAAWSELRLAARDASLYCRSSEGRLAVEQSRVFFLPRRRLPTVDALILRRTLEPVHAYGLLRRAALALLPVLSVLEQPLADWVDKLEVHLCARRPQLADAEAAPGASAASIIAELEQLSSVLSAGAEAAPHGAGSAGLPAGSGSRLAHYDALEMALRADPYKAFARSLASCAVTTAQGRIDALAAGFSPECIITTRLLCLGETQIARRSSALGRLFDLRPHLPEYFTRALLTHQWTKLSDSPHWSITGEDGSQTAFLERFLRLDLASMDWMGVMLGMLRVSEGRGWPAELPAADSFCIPLFVQKLIPFGEQLLEAIGVPSQLRQEELGLTWRSWWTLYLKYLEHARRLPNRERALDWLDVAHEQALAALRLMSSLLKALISSAVPAERRLGALLPDDCRPAVVLREKARHLDEDLACDARFPFLHHLPGAAPDGWDNVSDFPLRSERHGVSPWQGGKAANRRPCGSASAKQLGDAATHKRSREPTSGPAAPRPMSRGNLKRIRKAHPPIDGRGPCYFHFQPGEQCPHGEACSFHHGA